MARQSFMFVAALVVAGICGFVQAQVGGGEAYLALHLNGGAYVSVNVTASEFATKEFSFEAWVKVPTGSLSDDPTDADGPLRPIISRYRTDVRVSNEENDFFFGINSQGRVLFFASGTADQNELGFLLLSNVTLVANEWYHLSFAIKYTDSNKDFPYKAFVYVDHYENGVLAREENSADWYGPSLLSQPLLSESFAIGRYDNGMNAYFYGTIDEVRIWQGRRSGSDFASFAFRSVADAKNDKWTLTAEQGGTSANRLVLSYNFNNEDYIFDGSQEGFDGKLIISNGEEEEEGDAEYVPNDNTPIVTYVYAVGSIPLAIKLWGVSSADIHSLDLDYTVTFNSELAGRLFRSHPKSRHGEEMLDLPILNSEVEFPGVGEQISSGSVLAADRDVVYVHTPGQSKNARFRYSVTDKEGQTSQQVEVRIVVACTNADDGIDVCGECNMDGASLDYCGVCHGDSTSCVGCDNVLNSGLEYDACGVCNGDNSSCAGCDNVPNSGLMYDDCGVCNGNNDTCWGCDGHQGQYDICGVCNGNNDTCYGCDNVAGSGLVYDECGVCDGDNSSCVGCDNVPNSGLVYDACGECNGDNSTCMGCNGVINSGIVEDACGDCGGNGSRCAGCDGSGGGVVDACGLCRGDNSTCGGCDGKGGVIDDCGDCGGDNSGCTCVIYKGYHVQELDYVLLQWGLTHSIEDINKALKYLDDSLGLLTNYRGDLDLAAVVLYLQDFLSNTAHYENTVHEFKRELDISLGNIYVKN